MLYGGICVVDLCSGKMLWDCLFGSVCGNGLFGICLGLLIEIGMFNNGGLVVIVSGLVFIVVVIDDLLCVIDLKIGKELWYVLLFVGG